VKNNFSKIYWSIIITTLAEVFLFIIAAYIALIINGSIRLVGF